MSYRLVLHQFRYDLLGFFRNRQSRFFTLALPVIFLVIFASVFGNDTIPLGSGVTVKRSAYYVPGIVTLGVISASLVNLAISVVIQRENGILKRRRSTPVPATVLIAGRALTSCVVAILIAVVLLLIGRVAYGVTLSTKHVPSVVLAVVVGSLCFCCLGFALAAVIGSEDAAQPVIQAVILPLYFISGVFFPQNEIPSWMLHVADLFPVRHLQQAMLAAFDPGLSGSAIRPGQLAILALWGAAGLAFAVWKFSWVPRGD